MWFPCENVEFVAKKSKFWIPALLQSGPLILENWGISLASYLWTQTEISAIPAACQPSDGNHTTHSLVFKPSNSNWNLTTDSQVSSFLIHPADLGMCSLPFIWPNFLESVSFYIYTSYWFCSPYIPVYEFSLIHRLTDYVLNYRE